MKTNHISKRFILAIVSVLSVSMFSHGHETIDRHALVKRNCPRVYAIDTLSSLSVGNGEFAFTVDVTGLQSFPELYRGGVPLGTQSQWGWHSFPNPDSLKHSETLKDYDFGRGRSEPYSVQFNEAGRNRDAAEWYRVNPHRLHLGIIGFADMTVDSIMDIEQQLDLWNGVISSKFSYEGDRFEVLTSCDADLDMVVAEISNRRRQPVLIRFPYPTGKHSDDGCDWSKNDRHHIDVVKSGHDHAVIRHTLDDDSYYVTLSWTDAGFVVSDNNEAVITPMSDKWSLTAHFTPHYNHYEKSSVSASRNKTAEYWKRFWSNGGVVDFSLCTDPRAAELERRVVLSQYLLAIQCAGSNPPQETGLTYNSWFGKFHMEMIWWHQAQFALYGHGDLLERTLPWYLGKASEVASEIAGRQGFEGVRWMKMTDPSGVEAPSKVGSFLIWQQPHLIYLAELLYRSNGDQSVIDRYGPLVDETARFMASFADYDKTNDRYVLKGIIPAQETLRAAETVNPPFELSYWHFGLATAQKWRERRGLPREALWDEIMTKISPLASKDGLYLAAETAPETYSDIRFTSDHMAVLASLGVLPHCSLVDDKTMKTTFDWIYDNWNWDKTWGWDYPTTAMNAVRLGEPEKAVAALLMDKRTNTYLPNGHNYQDSRLRCYLPGNGGLLTAVALMCAGWDGCEKTNPGFPDDGTWNVRWEGILPLP